MSHFTKKLQTQQGLLEFYFNRIYTVSGTWYHVSVNDGEQQPHFFHMDNRSGDWHLVQSPGLPGWITALQEDLSKAIRHHKRSSL